jgi:hypothetical protein
MEVLILQIFVSLVLVTSGVILYLVSARHRDHEHADRLSLSPLEADTAEDRHGR